MNYVTTLEQLEASIHELRSQKILGFDTETCPWLTEGTKRQAFTNPYNLTSSGEAAPFDPHTSYIRLMQWQGENTTGYVWDMLKIGPKAKPLVVDFIKSLSKEQTVVGHNIKFDLKMLAGNYDIWLDHYTNIFDTMQCSILLANAVGMRERGHKLKDISRDFIGVNLDKTDQASDWSKPELTESQLDYAVSDVTYLHQLYDFFKSALEKDYGMSEALQIEMECIGPVARMEYNGVPINLDMYHKIQEAAQYAMPALLGQIGQYFKDKINQPLSLTYVAVKDYETKTENYIPFMLPWGGGKAGKDFLMSRANLVKEMIQELGLTDEDGEPLSTTAKEALIPHMGNYEGISFLLDYWNLVKQSQFEYDKYVHPLTNSVHPRFNPGGASTGRFSCTTPNLQQVPGKLKMKHPDGSEVNYRQCFEAPSGWLMCSADFSGQELAVMSAMSDDPIMMRTLNENGDLHSEAAAAMFNIPLSEVRKVKPGDLKDNTYRDYGKIVNFSLAYGKTAAGFAADWKIDKKEAEDIINKFNKKFSVLSHWLSSHGKIGDEQGFSRLDFGPIRFVGQAKRADKDAPKRASMNYQIQGLSSWMTRLAMNMLDEISFKNGYNIKLVATIHDEILSIFKCDPTCKTGQAFFAGQKPTEEQIHACVAGCAHDCAYKYEQVIESCMRRAGEHFLKHKVPAAATVGTGKHWKH